MRIETTDLFWDCECEKKYIHLCTEERCGTCGAIREFQPDSRKNEVIQDLLHHQPKEEEFKEYCVIPVVKGNNGKRMLQFDDDSRWFVSASSTLNKHCFKLYERGNTCHVDIDSDTLVIRRSV